MNNIDQFREPDNGLTSRRVVLRSLGTVLASGGLAGACQAMAAHPDSELLRFGTEFDRLHAAWLPIRAEVERLNGQFEEEWAKRWLSIDENFGYWPNSATRI
jgi:hypothetical protein